jgi:hypothetical protein
LPGELSDGERSYVETEEKRMASDIVYKKQRAGKKIEETLERAKEIF